MSDKQKQSVLSRVGDFAMLAMGTRRFLAWQHSRNMKNDPHYRDTFGALLRTRRYRSAQMSSTKTPWAGGSQSADAEISNDLPTLRDRSRELNRDDPIASGLIGTFVSNIIGTGMQAQAATKDAEKNTAIEGVWNSRKDDLFPTDDVTHGEAQRLHIGKWLEDGDVLIKTAFAPASRAEPVWFETIEADRLQTPIDMLDKAQKGFIRDGVERDSHGRPELYWILKQHPGENFTTIPGQNKRDFLAIQKQFIVHLKSTERPGQTRGVPFLHAVLQDLRDMDLLMLASLKRVQIAACMAAFIKTTSMDDIPSTTDNKGGQVLDQAIEPGMIYQLYPDEEIQTLIPNFPTPEFKPFFVMLATRIAAAVGVSWQTVLRDFSDSTYSSARTDLLETWRTYDTYAQCYIDRFLNWQWFQVLSDEKRNGNPALKNVSEDELRMVRWIPMGRKWVDPFKEAKAAQAELDMGLTTLRDLAASRGQDWEDIQDQRIIEEARDKEKRKAAGLVDEVEPPPTEPKT